MWWGGVGGGVGGVRVVRQGSSAGPEHPAFHRQKEKLGAGTCAGVAGARMRIPSGELAAPQPHKANLNALGAPMAPQKPANVRGVANACSARILLAPPLPLYTTAATRPRGRWGTATTPPRHRRRLMFLPNRPRPRDTRGVAFGNNRRQRHGRGRHRYVRRSLHHIARVLAASWWSTQRRRTRR